ncbi:MAG TPA: hypothetical protein VF056_06235 [Thermoleophilaceae bacterium]
MNENYLLFNQVPLGHPGSLEPVQAVHTDPFHRAAAEAELLRARLRHGESHAGNLGAVVPEAA